MIARTDGFNTEEEVGSVKKKKKKRQTNYLIHACGRFALTLIINIFSI